MKKIILAFAGEMGSGKGAIAEYLTARHGAEKFRFSTIMRDVLDRLHMETTRENVQNMSTVLRTAFWDNILSEVIVWDMGQSDASLIVLDGVRRAGELDSLRALGRLVFVYVHVDPKIRYARIIARGENVSEHLKTFEDFQKDSTHETETRIQSLQGMADFVIENNGTLSELHAAIDALLEKLQNG